MVCKDILNKKKEKRTLLIALLPVVIFLAAMWLCLPVYAAEEKVTGTAEVLSAVVGWAPGAEEVLSAADEDTADETETVPSKVEKYKSRDYVIDAYDIHVKLKENNEMEITEKLTVWFNEPRHGIYRTLPLRNTVRRMDGTTTNNRAKVKDVSVSENYETETESDNLKIRIGDADRTVTGEHNYTISYTYKLGKDPLEGKDEYYYNLVGSEWTSPIGGITFTIEMPKDFDETKLGFSAGWARSADSTGVTWKVNGLTITGNYNGILEPGQALTVRTELPEGYFVDAGFENRVLDIICFGLLILFLLISLFLWFKFGRDDMVVETVEFYPPDGINSLDAGYYYRGEVGSQDVTSLLIYLANQGYLQIEETEEKGVFRKKKTFRIIEARAYDGTDPNEKTFMTGLFKGVKKKEGALRSVTAGQLYDSFYTTTNSIMKKEREKSKKLFENNTGGKSALIMLMILASAVLICIPPILTYDMPATLAIVIFPIIGFGICFGTILGGKGKGRRKGKQKKGTLLPSIIAVGFGLAFGVIPLVALLIPLLEENTFHMAGFFVGVACIIGMIICFVFMPKRTPFGIEMLGRLEGFRNFLEVAEKQQLEQLVMEDPQYFYKILPYTYVLGVSDKWISKFEAINMEAPYWYYGPYYGIHDFGDSMDRTMATANRAMTSSPSESSGGGGGGGFSGGGFSGGGSGGGGGGSW